MTEFSSSLSSLVFGRTRAGGSFLFQESLNHVLDRLEQKHIIKTIDLMPIFCPGEICNYNGPGGIILYRDAKSHPTEEAAELSGKIFREAMIDR